MPNDSVDQAIEDVRKALHGTARALLKYIATHQLTSEQYQKLAKFLFGCMNQRETISGRVADRGAEELEKVRTFMDRAVREVLEIDGHKIQDFFKKGG